MTNQEAFNLAYIGVSKQGKPAYDPEMGCRYRTRNGLKCAIGQCFSDDQYDPGAEGDGETKFSEMHSYAAIARALGFAPELGGAMQASHDHNRNKEAFVTAFQDEMHLIAKQYNLTVPVVE